MNTEMNNQNSQIHNDIYLNNNQSTIDNNLNSNKILDANNMQMPNYSQNNNGKNNNGTKKIIIISISVLISITIILILVNLLLKSPNNDSNKSNQQNQINTNKEENIVENQEQLNEYEDDEIKNNEELITNDDTYIENTSIIKRSLGQTSTFDNGISINITNSISYGDDDEIYHNPMFIKVEISNNSNKNFYQNEMHGMYSTYTENPVEFIRDDFDYTSFDIIPMYLLGDEVKTERCGCVLRKIASTDSGTSDGQGGFSDINYFVVKPGEKTTAYLMCYFREEIEGAKIKTIYLLKNSNEFMYFMD